jgi:2'-5' RNA ligase
LASLQADDGLLIGSSMRLFVAIELPEVERRHLAELPKRSDPWISFDDAALNWTREENLHVTLKFLGAVADEHVPAIADALATVRVPGAISLRIEHLVFLPRRGPIRVLAAAVGGATDRLAALQAGIELALEPCGFSRERRAFFPHVTLARPRRERQISRQARADVASDQPLPGGEFVVDQFVLMQSDLSTGPPRYTRVARFRFVV